MNRYIKYFERIRMIQDYLCQQAEQHRICRIDNTNMDRTLVILHRVLYNVLKRQTLPTSADQRPRGVSPVLDLISEEFARTMEGICGSKEMIRWIQKRAKQTHHKTDTVKTIMNTEAWLPSLDEDMLSIEDTIGSATLLL
jgi:hypothetical protein